MSDFERFKPEKRRHKGIVGLLQRTSLGTQLVISIVLAIAFLMGILWVFPPVAIAMGVTTNPDVWGVLDGFVALATLAVLFGGGIFVLGEYIESDATRKENAAQVSFSLFERMFDQLMDPDEVAARRWILQNVPKRAQFDTEAVWILAIREILFKDEAPGAVAEGHRCVKKVLNTFDYMGFVANNYWELEGPLIEWMAPPVAKVWELIGPYIEEEARRRNEPDYYKWARFFGFYCIEWRRRQNLPQPNFVDRAL